MKRSPVASNRVNVAYRGTEIWRRGAGVENSGRSGVMGDGGVARVRPREYLTAVCIPQETQIRRLSDDNPETSTPVPRHLPGEADPSDPDSARAYCPNG